MKRIYAARCPMCDEERVIGVIADVGSGRLHLYGPEHAGGVELFSKCPKCGLQIDIFFEGTGHS